MKNIYTGLLLLFSAFSFSQIHVPDESFANQGFYAFNIMWNVHKVQEINGEYFVFTRFGEAMTKLNADGTQKTTADQNHFFIPGAGVPERSNFKYANGAIYVYGRSVPILTRTFLLSRWI